MPKYDSKPMSMRDAQIREILDEDLKAYKEVFKREFHQARLLNESYAPPNRFERAVGFAIDKYFSELQQAIDVALETQDSADAPLVLSLYSQLIDYINRFTARNTISQRDISVIEDKFDKIEPSMYRLAALAQARGFRMFKQLDAVQQMIEDRTYLPIKFEMEQVKASPQMLVNRNDFRLGERQREVEPPRADFGPPPRAVSPEPVRGRTPKRAAPAARSASVTPRKSRITLPEIFQLKNLIRDLATSEGFELPPNFNEIKKQSELKQIYFDIYKVDRKDKAYVSVADKQFKQLVRDVSQSAQATREARQAPAPADADAPPEYNIFDEPAPEPQEGFGEGENIILSVGEHHSRKGKGRKHRQRFGAAMFGGVGGDTEGEMGGLPEGFARGLELRPHDRKPLTRYATDIGLDGMEKDLELGDRMYFLNQLDSHQAPTEDNEFKMNSTQNLRKERDYRVKKLKTPKP
jgi:hypothetical protein